ncbi:Cobalamin synthesis protein/P47K protein, partial [Pseudomonas syringae pv. maculicola]
MSVSIICLLKRL